MVKIVRLRRRAKPLPTIYSKWVYDDGGAEPGEEVLVETFDRKPVGIGIFDGVGAVSVRLLSIGTIDSAENLIRENILYAYRFRKALGWDSYRLVNSDGDLLPGLIIDVYSDVAVIQSGSLGMDHYLEHIKNILLRYDIARHIYVRNNQRSRKEVGLDTWADWIHGRMERIVIDEAGVKYIVDVENGHKTGFFLDQRMNRLEARLYSRDADTLDLFSYTGGFGLHALAYGAEKVVFVEKDRTALELLYENIKLNKLEGRRYEVIDTDVWRFLEEDGRYSLIFNDPNALIQSREEINRGVRRYKQLYKASLSKLVRGGIAFLSSCSYFLSIDKFLEITRSLGDIQFIGRVRGASPDHLYRPDTPELTYLKALYIRKT